METLDFDDRKRKRRLPPPGLGASRAPGARHRPRSREDWDTQLALGLERRRLYLASGKLVVTEDGYEFEIGSEKLRAWLASHD